MELSLEQLAVVGLVASFITHAIRLYANYKGAQPSATVIEVILGLVSLGLGAAFFGLPEFPADAGFLGLANALLVQAVAVVGAATLIYIPLAKKVFVPAK